MLLKGNENIKHEKEEKHTKSSKMSNPMISIIIDYCNVDMEKD